MGRDKNVDKKEINIFCVATFSVALCNSLIILGISTLLIWGCDNYLKVLKWSVYIMLAFQLAEIVVEFSFLNTILNIREFWYVIMAQLSRQKFDVFIMN